MAAARRDRACQARVHRTARAAAPPRPARQGGPRPAETTERIFMGTGLPAPAGRRIALIAHDNKKQDMLEWAEYNPSLLAGHELFATATTGRLVHEQVGVPVTRFRQRPFGGGQQIASRRAAGRVP